MKRDFDRIRQILLDCEESISGDYALPEEVSDFDNYQIEKMIEAGLITIVGSTSVGIYAREGFLGHTTPTTIKMTWTGHDYLDAVRSAGIWEETKAAVAETGGSATIEVLKSLAVGFAKKKISEHTGIDIT